MKSILMPHILCMSKGRLKGVCTASRNWYHCDAGLTRIGIAVQYGQAASHVWYGACIVEETAMSERDDDLLFFAGLVLGAIAGGALAALLTPQSGPEIREQIAER